MSTIVTRLAKGSSLSYQELDDNFSNLNTDKLELTNLSVTDSGGDGSLTYNNATGVFTYTGPSASDVRAHISAGTGISITDGAISTTITQYADSNARSAVSVTDSGGDGSLSYNSSTGVITYTGPETSDYRSAFTAGTGISITDGVIANTQTAGITDIVQDTTPQLGGNLDLNGNQIVSLSSAVVISADGYIELDTTTTAGNKTIYIGNNYAEALKLQHSFWPSTAGTANYFLKTDGAGNTSWALPTAGLSDVVADTTPQLGGNLDVNGNSIVSVSNGNITLAPNGTGKVVANNLNYRETIHSLGTTSGTIAPNVTNGNVQSITLNGNITFNGFTSPAAGQSVTLIINTGGTNRTLTSTMKFANADKTLSTTNTTDIISVYYDGTNYWASLSKGFA